MKTKLPATAHKNNVVYKIYNTKTQLYWSGKYGWTSKGKTFSKRGTALNAISYHNKYGYRNPWQDCVLIEYSTLVSNVSNIRIPEDWKASKKKIGEYLEPLSLLTDIEFEG